MENGEPTHTQNPNPTTITSTTTNTTIATNIISPVPQQSQHHGGGGSVPVPVPVPGTGQHHHGALTLGLHPHNNNNNTVTVAVAVPQQPVVASARDDCWSEEATTTLIEAWGERYVNLNRGNLKQKHWQEVSDAVNSRGGGSKSKKTDVQCKNRLDTLKKKYKTEKGRLATHGVSRWPLYSKMDSLIGLNRKQQQQQQQQHQIVPKESPQQQQPVPLLQSLPAPPLALPPPSKQRPIDGSGSSGDGSPDSTQSCPKRAKRIENSPKRAKEIENSPKRAKGIENNGENPVRELANAILKFGEVYERIEMTKHQQMIELEKHKMEFTKEIELQRMQMIAQTQLEIAKLENTKSGATEHYL